jgi:hypothetical protein
MGDWIKYSDWLEQRTVDWFQTEALVFSFYKHSLNNPYFQSASYRTLQILLLGLRGQGSRIRGTLHVPPRPLYALTAGVKVYGQLYIRKSSIVIKTPKCKITVKQKTPMCILWVSWIHSTSSQPFPLISILLSSCNLVTRQLINGIWIRRSDLLHKFFTITEK